MTSAKGNNEVVRMARYIQRVEGNGDVNHTSGTSLQMLGNALGAVQKGLQWEPVVFSS